MAEVVMQRNKIVAIFMWLIIGFTLIFIFNAYPQTKVLSTGSLLLLSFAIIVYLAHRRNNRGKATELIFRRIKPATVITVVMFVLIFEIVVFIVIYKFAQNNTSQIFLVAIVVQALLFLGVMLMITSVRMIMRDRG